MIKQKGFTLIELVVVMVILGIMAAYAIPKFYDFRTQANISVINGAVGALSSGMVTAHGAAIATNATGATGSITMEGTPVNLAFGFPTGAGIVAAVNASPAFTVTSSAASATYQLNGSAT